MKNLHQQTRFDSPIPTIKFLCRPIDYSGIDKKHYTQLLN